MVWQIEQKWLMVWQIELKMMGGMIDGLTDWTENDADKYLMIWKIKLKLMLFLVWFVIVLRRIFFQQW